MSDRIVSGKSEPQSTIQPTDFDNGGGEKRRAPSAAYAPAPPITSFAGAFPGPKSISSIRNEPWLLYLFDLVANLL
jgi:hypothetical protein